MGKDKPQTRDSEYDKINQLYDECLIYLETLNEKHCDENSKLLSNGKETKDTYEEYPEEPGYETIKVKDEIKIEPQPQPKKVPIKLVIPEEPVLVEARNECISPQLITVEDELSKIKNVPVQIVIPEELLDAKNENISPAIAFAVENELKSNENLSALPIKRKMSRLRRLSEQIPKIIITRSPGIDIPKQENHLKLDAQYRIVKDTKKKTAHVYNIARNPPPLRTKTGYGDFPKRVVTKSGIENVALISNVPYEKIRLLNDTFHTLINLRWRWIVSGTIVVHFAMWLVFAVFWYITALAHYDFDPDPPKKSCITGGTDFVTIFLASVEAQTTIGFGDRAIDEECPESIFLFIMQLILGTGLSGVLTCVVYAKLTRPEKLSRDGVGFSKKAVISMRDGRLCLMLRAWDLNFDHIISSEFTAHFINTHKTTEGELLRYYARSLSLQQRQFLLWPVTLVHTIDATSPLFQYTPELLANNNYEITVSLKGASASLGTFTQSQTSYMPKEIVWGHRFPSVVQFDSRKQKYVIDHKKLDVIEPVDTPMCSAMELYNSAKESEEPSPSPCPTTPSSFNERISSFVLQRSSSFRNKEVKS